MTKSAFLPLEARFRRWGRGAGRRVKEVGYGGGGVGESGWGCKLWRRRPVFLLRVPARHTDSG